MNDRIRHEIISNAKLYVKSYSFLYARDNLTEKQEEIGLEVKLHLDSLRQNLRSLGVLNNQESRGAVIVLIRETGIQGATGNEFWDYMPISETSLTQKIGVAGYPIITRNELRTILTSEIALTAVMGDLGAVLDIGGKTGAEIVIVGTATASRSRVDEETIQANISVKAVSVSKGLIIAAKSDFASAKGETDLEGELRSFEEASSKISNFLLSSFKNMEQVPSSPAGSAKGQQTPATPELPFGDL